jgi:hypothetical protein
MVEIKLRLNEMQRFYKWCAQREAFQDRWNCAEMSLSFCLMIEDYCRWVWIW